MFLRNVLFFVFFAGISLVATAAPQTIFCNDGGPVIIFDEDILRVGPNPADAGFTIETREGVILLQVEMINQQGEIVRSVFPNAEVVDISTANLPNGLYTLRISIEAGVAYTTLLVQHV